MIESGSFLGHITKKDGIDNVEQERQKPEYQYQTLPEVAASDIAIIKKKHMAEETGQVPWSADTLIKIVWL